MTGTITHQPDPKLDLVLERVGDVAPTLVWAAWTRPEYVKQWHADMGFHEGWGKTLDQLVAIAKRM